MIDDDAPPRRGGPPGPATTDRGAAVAVLIFVVGFGGMIYSIGAAVGLF